MADKVEQRKGQRRKSRTNKCRRCNNLGYIKTSDRIFDEYNGMIGFMVIPCSCGRKISMKIDY